MNSINIHLARGMLTTLGNGANQSATFCIVFKRGSSGDWGREVYYFKICFVTAEMHVNNFITDLYFVLLQVFHLFTPDTIR